MKYHCNPIIATFLLTVFAAVLFAFCEPIAISANPATNVTAYVCPPCGCDKDNAEFDKPGTCPTCGMHLVEKGSAASRPAPPQPNVARRKVAILIFDGVQIIDYTGPWEVFGQSGFEVFTVAQKPDPITTTFGMQVTPTHTFADHPKPDILLVPGGDVSQAQKDPQTLKWIQETADKAEIVLSVCNGAYIIARAGLLNGLTATTTAPLIDGLANIAPNIKVVYDKRFVDNGKVITAAGLSSGIDGALHVIEKLYGRGTAQRVALGMEYNWDPESKFARAALADRYMRFNYDVDGAQSVSRAGTTERWENKWVITSELSAAQILDKVNDALATGKTYGPPLRVKWVRADDGKEKTRSLWRFTDEQGKAWQGAASVEPVAGEKNKYLMSVSVARGESDKQAKKAESR